MVATPRPGQLTSGPGLGNRKRKTRLVGGFGEFWRWLRTHFRQGARFVRLKVQNVKGSARHSGGLGQRAAFLGSALAPGRDVNRRVRVMFPLRRLNLALRWVRMPPTSKAPPALEHGPRLFTGTVEVLFVSEAAAVLRHGERNDRGQRLSIRRAAMMHIRPERFAVVAAGSILHAATRMRSAFGNRMLKAIASPSLVNSK